jgi:CubicO group peptidase (beta-lactamase class C family)
MTNHSNHQNTRETPLLVDGIGRRQFAAAALGTTITFAGSQGSIMADETKATGSDKFNSELEKLVATYKVPGLAAARVTTEGVVIQGCAGVRKNKSSEKIGPHDRFHLGSNTKSMTATLAAMLVQEKKLGWDTTIAEIFMPKGYEINENFGKATLKQLLSHRAGLKQISGTEPEWIKLAEESTESPEKARETYARSFLKRAPAYEVGSKFEYSNEGFMIAGHMLEIVTSKSWEVQMREQLFEPLGMKSAGFGAPGTKDKVDEPRGHSGWWKPIEPGPEADNPAGIGPAGTVHANLEDWGKFIAFFLRAVQGKEARLYKESCAVLMTPPDKLSECALGWVTAEREWAGGKAIWHNGSNTLWYAMAWLAPEKGIAGIAACNQMGSWPTSACDAAITVMIKAT